MEYMEMVKNRSVFNIFLRMYVHGNILPAKSSSEKVNPYKACSCELCRDFLDGDGYDLGTKFIFCFDC